MPGSGPGWTSSTLPLSVGLNPLTRAPVSASKAAMPVALRVAPPAGVTSSKVPPTTMTSPTEVMALTRPEEKFGVPAAGTSAGSTV